MKCVGGISTRGVGLGVFSVPLQSFSVSFNVVYLRPRPL
jgi:hypothetical protein